MDHITSLHHDQHQWRTIILLGNQVVLALKALELIVQLGARRGTAPRRATCKLVAWIKLLAMLVLHRSFATKLEEEVVPASRLKGAPAEPSL